MNKWINDKLCYLTGPLERGCSPVIIPICQNVGYTHTIITQKRQKRFYKYWYRKNYTNSAVVSIPRQNSWAQDLMTNKKMSRCAQNVKKLFCVEHIPPCFPEEGIAYYTACRDLCKNVTIECPEVLRTRMRSYFLYCEKLAFGEAYKGFCKHRSWPPPMKWLDFFKAGEDCYNKEALLYFFQIDRVVQWIKRMVDDN